MVIKSMAQNFVDDTKTTNATSANCPLSILKSVPVDCEKITFSELKSGQTYKNKAIIGKISLLNPIGKRANGSIRKILVTDALDADSPEDQMKLTVFLLDEFADDSTVAELEGYIIITNFHLEKSTHYKSNELPFQVLVKKGESQVLIGRKVPKKTNVDKSVPRTKKQAAIKDDNNVPQTKKQATIKDDNHVVLSNHYDYVFLGDLKESEAKETFNVYGIVDKCDLKVTQGKRTQILDLIITDESETGFVCSIFAAKDEVFPDIYPGDIVRVHRMQVYKFRSKLKGKCLMAKFILVFSKSNKGSKPRTVAKSFTFTADDSKRVKDLFEWYDRKSEPKLISEINRGDFVNIVCQVIAVYCAKTTDAVILKIWDGTKTNQFDSSHWGLKDETLDEKLFTIAKHYYVVLSVYGQHAAPAAELKPGQFIEVRDAHLFSPKDNPDDCKLCLHAGNIEGRGIQVLDHNNDKLIKLKERLENIVLASQEIGNQTEDLLNENNSIFLNCDISMYPSSQRSTARNEEDIADVEALNMPLTSRNENIVLSENTVISVTDAAIKPGQSTQEFGEGTQREYHEMDISEDVQSASEPDPVLNKTPLEFKMFLHNPQGESNASPSFFPFTNDMEEEWWNSVPTVSETEDHSEKKPSSLTEVVAQKVPHKFRILCVIFSYKPETTSIRNLIHLYCPKCSYMTEHAMPNISPFEERDDLFYFHCPECSATEVDKQNWPVLKYTYLVSFDLHDGTGPSSLEVHLWKENAVKFFKGISPEQALKNNIAAESIFQMLWSICPNSRPFDSSESNKNTFSAYPILDCCVLSYVINGGTFYQMFDTKLK